MRETKRMNCINYVTAGQRERRRRREGWTANREEDERIWHSEWIFGVCRQTEPSGKQFEILNPATKILSVRLFLFAVSFFCPLVILYYPFFQVLDPLSRFCVHIPPSIKMYTRRLKMKNKTKHPLRPSRGQ